MAKVNTPNIFIDMVHDNPGESPFETRYRDPKTLASLGYTGQVAKDILASVPFDSLGIELFPAGSDERNWFDQQTEKYRSQITAAKKAGLDMYYHIDLFVFPQKLVQYYADEMLVDGLVNIDKEQTRQLCRVMLRELFDQYPDLPGLVVRVGETYLQDMPYHTGNSAVKYTSGDTDFSKKQEQFILLINLLREEVCEKMDRTLIFRTWDCYSDCFHADPDYYLAVTDQIIPHEKLYFSIKHTALDFWRRVRFNPCLMIGKHQQIAEVQCQREYEGKGAYPMYHMGGVINGFTEVSEPKGLKDIAGHPLFKGVFSWTRGGGWNGPYVCNEFWIDLNVEVLSRWVVDPIQKEEDIFLQVMQEKGLNRQDAIGFRQLCDLAQEAVLKGRYCQGYDAQYQEKVMPVENWLRDDHIGGERQLKPIFDYLHVNGLLEEAIEEKRQACRLWDQVEQLASQIHFPDSKLDSFFHVTVSYGRQLYKIICCGWEIIAAKYQNGQCDAGQLKDMITVYQQALVDYKKLFAENPVCPSLYQFTRRVNEYGDEISTFSADNYMVENGEGMDHWVNGMIKGNSQIVSE